QTARTATCPTPSAPRAWTSARGSWWPPWHHAACWRWCCRSSALGSMPWLWMPWTGAAAPRFARGQGLSCWLWS
ncbi:unnamed protein product, partial [Effrenium voratum]